MNKLTKRNQLDIGLHFNSCNNEISNQKNIDNECLVIVYYVGSLSLSNNIVRILSLSFIRLYFSIFTYKYKRTL